MAAGLRLLDLKVGQVRGRYLPAITFHLRPDTTWPTALRDAFGLGEGEPLPLTRPGERLLQKVQSGAITGTWFSRESLNRQVGAGHYRCQVEDCCLELAQKRGVYLKLEVRKSPKGGYGEELRLDPTGKPASLEMLERAPAVNFRWDRPVEGFGKSDTDAFRQKLLAELLAARPVGTTPFAVFRARTLEELSGCFPGLRVEPFNPGGPLAQFLRAVRLPKGLTLAFDLRIETAAWWIALHPTGSWAEALKAVEEDLARPTLEQRLGLSHDAARLLEWIESVPPDQYLASWTPVVEPRLKAEVGLKAEWPRENLPALFQLLVDEINAKTAYELSLQPWRENGEERTRIKVARKATPDQELEAALGRWAAATGVQPSTEKLAQAIALLKRT